MKGNGHKKALHFDHPPERVVSLVPSMTESLFELGLGGTVVGVTDFCTLPAQGLEGLPRLGGPKNADPEQIAALHPDLVLANQEENSRQLVEALEEKGIRVWVTFPKSVRGAMDVLWAMAGIFQSRLAAVRLEVLDMTLEWAESSVTERKKFRYFCPIWQHIPGNASVPAWWMTFNQTTYPADLLSLMGGENVFASRVRRYPLEADLGRAPAEEPGERDTRYPRVDEAEIREADPQVILLPSEPFGFDETHKEAVLQRFSGTAAAESGQVILLDGSLLTWHGTRLAHALRELPELLGDLGD